MIFKQILKNKSFLVYGLGLTGQSVIKFLKETKAKKISLWDDDINLRKKFNLNKNISIKKKISEADFIILSPGVSLRKSNQKKLLKKNENKIITDIDLFFLTNKIFKSIVVTGTNGKSTTCSIIKKVLSDAGYNTVVVGNIGKPILNYKLGNKSNVVIVIEMSSFQLEYSKFVRPNHAILINITKDHLDWHGSVKNYINAKFKIFSLQNRKDYAYLPQQNNIIKLFNIKNMKSNIIINKKKVQNLIKKNISNTYLMTKSNLENLSFIYYLKNNFKISNKSFFYSLKNFKGLEHRQEIFFKKNNVYFINDSKATTFAATEGCLMNFKNIIWIVGGLKKIGDKFNINKIKKNILKVFIIGKNRSFFKNKINKKINYLETINIQKTIKNIFIELKNFRKNQNKDKIFVILSPASASYDQFKNFEERGKIFKKLITFNAKKYL
tara:strand:+ start:147 stop:1463 length:1317 start_codon:yes stop_codon:yes gene_type:complete